MGRIAGYNGYEYGDGYSNPYPYEYEGVNSLLHFGIDAPKSLFKLPEQELTNPPMQVRPTEPPSNPLRLMEWRQSPGGQAWINLQKENAAMLEADVPPGLKGLANDARKRLLDAGPLPTELARRQAYFNAVIPSGYVSIDGDDVLLTKQRNTEIIRGVKRPRMGVMEVTKIPVVDWDWPDPVHVMPGQVTVQNLGDVAERVGEYTKKNPNSRMQLYMTPGGVHGIEVGIGTQSSPFNFYQNYADILEPDIYYKKMAKTLGAYRLRVTPKEQRLNKAQDFIGLPIGSFGQGLPDPSTLRNLELAHNKPIAYAVSRLKDYQYQDPRSYGLELLDAQIDTVSNPQMRRIFDQARAKLRRQR